MYERGGIGICLVLYVYIIKILAAHPRHKQPDSPVPGPADQHRSVARLSGAAREGTQAQAQLRRGLQEYLADGVTSDAQVSIYSWALILYNQVCSSSSSTAVSFPLVKNFAQNKREELPRCVTRGMLALVHVRCASTSIRQLHTYTPTHTCHARRESAARERVAERNGEIEHLCVSYISPLAE